jgi:hypothetical protein
VAAPRKIPLSPITSKSIDSRSQLAYSGGFSRSYTHFTRFRACRRQRHAGVILTTFVIANTTKAANMPLGLRVKQTGWRGVFRSGSNHEWLQA